MVFVELIEEYFGEISKEVNLDFLLIGFFFVKENNLKIQGKILSIDDEKEFRDLLENTKEFLLKEGINVDLVVFYE